MEQEGIRYIRNWNVMNVMVLERMRTYIRNKIIKLEETVKEQKLEIRNYRSTVRHLDRTCQKYAKEIVKLHKIIRSMRKGLG